MRSVLPFPRSLKLSQLVHGEVGDFIINAHLAMQHRWPDRRAYDQYKKRLKAEPGARAQIVREIAASKPADEAAVELVDDLPPDYQFTHTGNDFARANQVGTQLRIYQLYHDMQTAPAGGGGGAAPSGGAVDSALGEQMDELSERFGRLSESVLQLYTEKEKGTLCANAPAAASSGPPSGELLEQLQAIRAEMAELRDEVRAATADVQYFKNNGLWELRRHVAEYVVAMLDVQQSMSAAQSSHT